MDQGRTSNELAHRLQRLVLRLNRELRAQNAGSGASNADAVLLAEVRHAPGLGVSELAAIENVARSVMSERVKRLEQASLLALDPRPQRDRRRVGLVITEAGRTLLEVITAKRRAWMAERLTALSAEERSAVELAVVSLERITGTRRDLDAHRRAVARQGRVAAMKKSKGAGLGRREVFGLAAASAIPALMPGSAAAAPTPGAAERGPGLPVPTPVVRTANGAVQGLVEDGVMAFKGVRYGAPPVGKLRFMPPKPAEPWTGTYDATDFGSPRCSRLAGNTVAVTSDAALAAAPGVHDAVRTEDHERGLPLPERLDAWRRREEAAGDGLDPRRRLRLRLRARSRSNSATAWPASATWSR